MQYDLKELMGLYQEEENKSATARAYCKKHNIEYKDSVRRRVSDIISFALESESIEDENLTTTTKTETKGYKPDKKFVLSAWNKETGKIMDIDEYCEKYNLPREDIASFKFLPHHYSEPSYNIAFRKKDVGSKFFKEEIINDLKKYSPSFKKIKRKHCDNSKLLVIDPADVHIGKLADAFETGQDYNSQIAVQRVREGVEGILSECAGHNIDQILFIGGNDILHTDTPKRTTTSGTPQDTDGMWYRNFLMAKDLYIEILEKLLSVADVHFTFNPSNHDYTNGFFLANVIETYFRNCKNITFDCSIAHRKYFKYGNNLIGTTHGDGAKQNDLPLLMATESEYYSKCKKRYIYIHHIHHKMSKDYPGVTLESLRSPSEADSWHHRNGYQHNPKAIEGFIHHKKHGQTARLTYYF